VNRSRYRILLVEDNPGDARLFKEMLSEASDLEFEIEQAGTLSEALGVVSRCGCDLIVLDLTLPDSRGIETFGVIQERGIDLPIIVLTGEQDASLGLRAVREGAQDYLVKGEVSSPTLARSVLYAIERHRQQKQLVQRARSKRAGVRRDQRRTCGGHPESWPRAGGVPGGGLTACPDGRHAGRGSRLHVRCARGES
jgi:DNA-binding NtrC family response regulator